MKRRDFIMAGTSALVTAALPKSVRAEGRKKVRKLIASKGKCSTTGSGPFSMSYRGTGSIIMRASSPSSTLAVVIPTVAKRKRVNEKILDLDGEVIAHGHVDHLVVCALHSHWDHAWHLDHFRSLAKDPCYHHEVIANETVFDKSNRSRLAKYNVSKYSPHILYGSLPPPIEFDFGDQQVRFTFVDQDHAPHLGSFDAHTGAGKGCSPSKRHCGYELRMVRHSGSTYAVHMELETRDENGDWYEFSVFANDAASGYIERNLPESIAKTDLALLTAADSHLAYGYPGELLDKLAPSAIRWVHWEEFVVRPRHSIKTEKLPWVAGKRVLPYQKVEALLSQAGCFPRHGYYEEFPGSKKKST